MLPKNVRAFACLMQVLATSFHPQLPHPDLPDRLDVTLTLLLGECTSLWFG